MLRGSTINPQKSQPLFYAVLGIIITVTLATCAYCLRKLFIKSNISTNQNETHLDQSLLEAQSSQQDRQANATSSQSVNEQLSIRQPSQINIIRTNPNRSLIPVRAFSLVDAQNRRNHRTNTAIDAVNTAINNIPPCGLSSGNSQAASSESRLTIKN